MCVWFIDVPKSPENYIGPPHFLNEVVAKGDFLLTVYPPEYMQLC